MAAIKINFDMAHNPEQPTIVLAHRSGKKIGGINATNFNVNDAMNAASEITFEVNKYVGGEKNVLWDKIKNFKLVWCKEWDTWFEITVEINELTETTKTVSGKKLSVAELSQIELYDYEINTETDIARDDYEPTVLYDPDNVKASLLHRILDKAPHYSIRHVDSSIAKLQRTFQFNDISIYDALQDIAKEIGCLVMFHSDSDVNGKVRRQISLYDLESNCHSCGYRGEFTSVCPECGSTEVQEGYGEDTTIFLSSDELANEILFTTDTGSMKNCFKLEGGDDLMTAAIRSCNPNGTDYIWYRTKDMEEDMSEELVTKLEDYDKLYSYYQSEYVANLNSTALENYNKLVDKYKLYNKDLETIATPVTGFSALMTAYYNTIDFSVYLQSALMPDVSMDDTDAAKQVAKLTVSNLSPVAVTNLKSMSAATADNAVLGMAKVVVDTRYQVKVNSSSLSGTTWSGSFVVTNYSDEEDTAVSSTVSIVINDNYETYVKQKIKKALHQEEVDNVSIVGLFDMTYSSFCNEIKKYCLDSLNMFADCCQTAIDILIEQGIADSQTWAGSDPNLYDDVYTPYYEKLEALQTEIKLRSDELDTINALQEDVVGIRNAIQKALDFQAYLGTDLWLEFCAFRREDKFTNENYISDGLNNAELFERALEFHKLARKEIYKSAELQHSISTSLKNLLLEEKFEPLLDYFEIGNWLRIAVDDKVYKLRLIKFEVDYNNLENISVDFSDVVQIADGISDLQSILDQAQSMASSYDTVQRQAEQGANSNGRIQNWIENGLDATNTKIIGGADFQSQTWDNHGMLFRQYNPFTDDFEPTQLKIVNSTLAVTDDNWRTVKTAVGAFYYFDPVTNELKYAYGINAEVLIGKLILGENLGLYSGDNSMTFDRNGLTITNNMNTFKVNPSNDKLLVLSNKDRDILWVDKKGGLHIVGDGTGIDITANDTITGMSSQITQTAEAITAEVSRAQEAESKISQTAYSISTEVKAEVERAKGVEASLLSTITQTAGSITSTVTEEINRAKGAEEKLSSQITQTAASIKLEVSNGTSSSTITLSGDGITTQAKTIQFTGQIVFASDLSTAGRTTINGSNISGGTLTLGGNGNGKGVLVIQDANGNQIGRWDNSGITATGSITATTLTATQKGTIGPWKMDANALYRGNLSSQFASDTFFYHNGCMYLGVNGFSISNQFKVDSNGNLTSNGATISGGTLSTQTSVGSTALTIGDGLINFIPNSASRYAASMYGGLGGEIRMSVSDQVYISIVNVSAGTSHPVMFVNDGQVHIQSVDLYCTENMTVLKTKSRAVQTEAYDTRLEYCYEMPSPMFGDIGEATLDDNGECYIYIDDIFAETIANNMEYYVFLQKEGEGDIWVSEKTPYYFVVKGTANLKFAWELKAHQRDYEFERLEQFDENRNVNPLADNNPYALQYEQELKELIEQQEALYDEYETA